VIAEQVRAAEETLAEQRAAIVAVGHSLRADQDDFATQMEAQQAQLTEVLSQLRAGAGDLTDNTLESSENLKGLVATAAGQLAAARAPPPRGTASAPPPPPPTPRPFPQTPPPRARSLHRRGARHARRHRPCGGRGPRRHRPTGRKRPRPHRTAQPGRLLG